MPPQDTQMMLLCRWCKHFQYYLYYSLFWLKQK